MSGSVVIVESNDPSRFNLQIEDWESNGYEPIIESFRYSGTSSSVWMSMLLRKKPEKVVDQPVSMK